MNFSKDCPVKIVMLGAGGTGGHAAPHLYRLLHSLERKVRFILVDGDTVEKKNLVRQNFTAHDLGRNKARTIAERYADAFGMNPEFIQDFIEEKAQLTELVKPKEHRHMTRNGRWKKNEELVILVGAVDNNKSRKMCHEVFMKAENLVYIDAGNGEFGGQVVCGVRRYGKTMFKPVGALYPDVLDETDKFPSELSCAEASISSPQAITANITAATIVVDIIYNIVVLGRNDVHCAPFSTKTVSIKPHIKQPERRKAA